MARPVIVCHAEDCPAAQHREQPMRVIDETYQHWIFRCDTCLNLRTIGKDRIGGTRGAGRREDQPAKGLW